MAGNSELKARGVEHGGEIIDNPRQLLELLADEGVIGVPGDIAEDIGRGEHIVRLEVLPGVAQEAGDGRHPVGLGRDFRQHHPGGIRKSHVIELDLVKAGGRGLLSHADRIILRRRLEGIDPGKPFAIVPQRPIGVLDGPLRPRLSQQRVLEDDDPADRIDPLGLQLGHESGEIADGSHLGGADLRRQRHLAGIGNEAPVALDIDDKGIESRRFHDVECRVAQSGRTDAVDGEIEPFRSQRLEGEDLAIPILQLGLDPTIAGGPRQEARPGGFDAKLSLGVADGHLIARGDRGAGNGRTRLLVDDRALFLRPPCPGRCREQQEEGEQRAWTRAPRQGGRTSHHLAFAISFNIRKLASYRSGPSAAGRRRDPGRDR